MRRIPLFFVTFLAATNLLAGPDAPFPFVPPWDDATPSVTNMSALLEKPAGSHGFVVAKDGHFFEGTKRIRFFGVNTAFGANFPTHEDAVKIAARMAKFGINCVRFHHMDAQATPNGIWSADLKTIDAEQLDKLDFFIAQLKANGIYADLNLHVSRSYPGMPAWAGAPGYWKGVDNFYPPMIEMQRDYARKLLKHVNPYTKTAYADEPAVAIVEINNENGLLREWFSGALDEMPDPYRAELQTRWNQWLQTKYHSQAGLEKAWNVTSEPLGSEMLCEENFANKLGSAWFLEQHEGAEAEVSGATTGSGLRIEVKKPGKAGWHVQLSQSKIALVQGKSYTISFRASAPPNSPHKHIRLVASQAHAPWDVLWSADLTLTPQWKDYQFTFQPSSSDENARIVFSDLGATRGDYEFADVSLRSGGIFELKKIPVFKKPEFNSRSVAVQRDWAGFLCETEENYWTGFDQFLKKDIKTRSIVVGTATGYSTPLIQAKLDAVDAHAYWQHPHFPHKPWDRSDWTVNNVSMAGAPDGGTLPGLALRRVAGKPYIVTEYNSPAPNSYSAETFLLLNAFAAQQDWDGVFAFAYSHRHDDWNSGRIMSFFDIDQHPAKLATLPAAVAMFVRGDVSKASVTTTVPVSKDQAMEASRRQGSWWDAQAWGVKKLACFSSAIQMQMDATPSPSGLVLPPAHGNPEIAPEITWDSAKSCVTVNAPRNKAFIGQGKGGPVLLGDVTITTPQEWASIAVTAMDGRDFKSPGRILITAVGNVENTGMRWTSAEKNSVGKDWGTAPALAWGVPTRVTLPVPAPRLRAWALDERGQRKGEIDVKPDKGGAFLELGPQHQTLWYEVEVKP